jgi:hypothetical protein
MEMMSGLEQERDGMFGPRKHLRIPNMMGSEVINDNPPTYGGPGQRIREPDFGKTCNCATLLLYSWG